MSENESYYVARLLAWPDGENYVEVYASEDAGDPGMLGVRYRELGEGMAHANPKAAAIAAVHIMRQWKKDKPDLKAGYSTNGQVAGAVGVPGNRDCSALDMFAWARHEYLGLSRCARCGEIIDELYQSSDLDEDFCSGYCVDEAWLSMFEEEE